MTADVRFGAFTHIGRVRELNEDNELHAPPLFAVADGMGGHSGGDVASAMAIEALLTQPTDLAHCIHQTNAAIYERSLRQANLSGMGTTLTVLRTSDESVEIAHVGDSRAYLLKDGSLKQLTEDHTEVAELVRLGRISKQAAAHHPRRNYLAKALGVFPEVPIDVFTIPAADGDRFLLCTDGLFGMLESTQIEQILEEEGDPQAAATRLCEAAVEAGGSDNVTAVVVDYGAAPRPDRGSPQRPQPKRKKTTRLLRYLAVAAVMVLGAGLIAKASLRNSWYVGDDQGHVAIFNGVPASIAGIELSEVDTPTEIATRDLPAIYQQRLEDGIRATDLQDARKIVATLKKLAQEPNLPPAAPTGTTEPTGTAEPAGTRQ